METIIEPITEYLEKFNGIFPVVIMRYDRKNIVTDGICYVPMVAEFENLIDLEQNLLPSDFEESFFFEDDGRDESIYYHFRDENLGQNPLEVLKKIGDVDFGLDYDDRWKAFYGPGAKQVLEFMRCH